MSSALGTNRPETPMGRALAERVLRHTGAVQTTPSDDIIDLTTAEPATTPAHVGHVAKSALDQGETHYTDASGIPSLRDAVSRHLDDLGFTVEPESIGVSNGGTEAVYIALQVALKPGDCAAIIEPMSRHIVDMVTFIGADPVRVETAASEGFVPNPAILDAMDAQALLIASPSPITGKRIPDAALEALVAAAREKEMAVILDLSYAAGLYEPHPVRFSDPLLAEQLILTGSFSTAHGLAGWRVGYFSSPPTDRVLLSGLKTAMSICTTAVSQFAAVAALGEPDSWFDERRARFAATRDLVTGLLDDAGLSYIQPDAFPALLINASQLGGGDAVARRLREDGFIVDAGPSFGVSTRDYIRINLGASREALADGVERMIEMSTCAT